MKPFNVLIDCGHGANAYTNGKFSPIVTGLGIENDPTVYDRRFREGNFNRLVGKEIADLLKMNGINAILLNTEDYDVSNSEKARRANSYCAKYGSKNCLLISIHANAAGNATDWYNAKGWLSIVDDCGSENSKKFANLLYDEVVAQGLKARQPNARRKWYYYRECIGKQYRLTILSKTSCPAVLTENFFYTDKEEVKFLGSPAGRKKIAQLHVNAILKYYHSL